MEMIYQRTVAKKISITGIGLHSGRKVTLTLNPALADFGIQFQRVDIPASPIMKANALSVGTTENATSLGVGKEAIHTVEHLLAAFYGLGLDNIFCEIDGPEIPIMDGSAAPFVFILKEAGITTLPKLKNFLVILEKVRVTLGDKWAEVEPAPRLSIHSSIVFSHPLIKTQNDHFEFSCQNFIERICRARTFGLLRDVDMLKRKGLIRGGSLDNAIVLDDYRILNPEGLRFADEFVRHKTLDTLGDMSLLGYEIAGKLTTYKSGHNLNNLLCRKIFETPECYKIVPASELVQEDIYSIFKLPFLVPHYS